MLVAMWRCLPWLVVWMATLGLGDVDYCATCDVGPDAEELTPELIRSEFLQTGHAHDAATRSVVRSGPANGVSLRDKVDGPNRPERDPESRLIKSTIAVSQRSIGVSKIWKLANLKVQETGEPEFLSGCGKPARASMPLHDGDDFGIHGVWATGKHNDRDGLDDFLVQQVEDMFTEELGNLSHYSPWMDMNFAFYDEDIDFYTDAFRKSNAKYLALDWQAEAEDGSQTYQFYSLITHAPVTQEVFEIISLNKPTVETLHHHPMPRHSFKKIDIHRLLQEHMEGPIPLHVSRTARNLSRVIAFYKEMFDLDPVATDYDSQTDVGYAFFQHGNDLPRPIRQVHYWHRGFQQNLQHTTHWLEEKLEGINSKYMQSGSTCWPVWGDNHYTITDPPVGYLEKVANRYLAKGVGFKTFRSGSHSATPGFSPEEQNMTFSTYFPLPGGWYMELHDETVPAPQAEEWTPDYCYSFSCRPGGSEKTAPG